MTTKGYFIAISTALLVSAGCTIPRHVPRPNEADEYPYGSEIHVELAAWQNGRLYIKGELLAADSACMMILPFDKKMKEAVIVKFSSVKDYTLYYAKPKNYSPAILLFLLSTFSHGGFMVLSVPVNIIVTTATTCKAAKVFTYRKRDLTPDQLRMFSRYPQYKPEDLPVTGYR